GMNSIFPPEIINVSIENHFAQFSKKSSSLYLVVLLFFIGAVISLFFIKAEITVQSRGVFRSSSQPIELISPVVAKVEKSNLNENQFVLKGDTLVWLECKKQSDRIDHIQKRILDNKAYLNDISAMLSYKYSDLATSLYKTTHAQYRQKLSDFDMQIDLFQKSYKRAKTLFDKQVIPATELENKQFQLDKVLEEKKIYVQMSRNEWQQLAVNYHQNNENYASEIQSLKSEIKNFTITAPAAGHITNYNGIKTGGFVSTGQTIAIISPDDSIMAEHLVSPQDIGYLYENMPVIFQVDAYNYNQWGTASGNVTEISNEIYIVNNQPFFKVLSSLDESCLSLKNGYQGKLKKGFTNTARYKITKRTLAQLLIDKTDNWLNPKIITE
ncbi:MAG TPA: HlyD family efflux transporter periplasmic adaptor subunit, partial [Draconibacterium sp.]|nr:HlyD family efflux transporter periplasmic adaptor subunit [Draconibacterium sp.]